MKAHVCTNGNYVGILVRDGEDLETMKKYILLNKDITKIGILAYAIMSNHLHFVLDGTEPQFRNFMSRLKQDYGIWLQHKYGLRGYIKRASTSIIPIEDAEALKRSIAYVLANPLEVNPNMAYFASGRSSGNCYFVEETDRNKAVSTVDFSIRKFRKLFHTRNQLSSVYLLDSQMNVINRSMVDHRTVETLFRTQNALNYYINQSSKMKNHAESEGLLFEDGVLASKIKDLSRTLFGKQEAGQLDRIELATLVKELKFRFRCQPKQISRVLYIDESVVNLMINKE